MFKGYVINQRINKIEVTIYTNQIPKQLSLDLQRHNAQYDPIDIQLFRQSHDRFLIIDEKELLPYRYFLERFRKRNGSLSLKYN